MSTQQPTYRSYLLRLWCAGGDGEPIWRAALEDALSGERRGFADLEALCAFLRLQIAGSPSPEETPEPCKANSENEGGIP